MLSRALSLATVTLLIGCLAAIPVQAQNLEAGKSPPRFSRALAPPATRAPRGLLEDRAGRIAAGLSAPALHHQRRDGLAAQRLSDRQRGDRYPRGSKPKPAAGEGCEARSPRAARPLRSPASAAAAARQEAARPEADPQPGRDRPRPRRPQVGCQAEAEQARQRAAKTAQARCRQGRAGEKRGCKRRIRRRAKPPRKRARKPPSETAKEASQGRQRQDARRQAVRRGQVRHCGKIDAPKANGEAPALRADPVPPVTPAPSLSAAASSGTPEPSTDACAAAGAASSDPQR